jgi:predicted HAD superfamily Cof-like phosphohydrolase
MTDDEMTELDLKFITMAEEFRVAMGQPSDPVLAARLMLEEGVEFLEAMMVPSTNHLPNLEQVEAILKEAGDVTYVMAGFIAAAAAALEAGTIERLPTELNALPLVLSAVEEAMGELTSFAVSEDDMEEIVTRIHASNMTKLGEDGKPIYNEDGKVLKGPNYAPPVLTDIAQTVLDRLRAAILFDALDGQGYSDLAA